jgi:cysteinyl-tRNA synthetase
VRVANKATEPAEKRALAESLRAGAWLLGLLTLDPAQWFRGTTTIRPSGVQADAQAGDPAAGGDDAEIDSLVKQRDALRQAKNFAEADRIRRELTERGIAIEDAAGGARWRRLR